MSARGSPTKVTARDAVLAIVRLRLRRTSFLRRSVAASGPVSPIRARGGLCAWSSWPKWVQVWQAHGNPATDTGMIRWMFKPSVEHVRSHNCPQRPGRNQGIHRASACRASLTVVSLLAILWMGAERSFLPLRLMRLRQRGPVRGDGDGARLATAGNPDPFDLTRHTCALATAGPYATSGHLMTYLSSPRHSDRH
jgi:hypothetical protein